MAGICTELFYLILITGCVLYLILGMFTLTGNIVLNRYAEEPIGAEKKTIGKNQLSIQFFISSGILLLFYILLALRNRYLSSKNNPSFIR